MIQSLPQSIGLDNEQVLILDTMRVKRNALNYTGEDMDEGSVVVCIDAAEGLLQATRRWLLEKRRDLIEE